MRLRRAGRVTMTLALTVAAALALRARAADRAPPGFDHLIHEGRVDVTLGKLLVCADCHRLDARGVPTSIGHAGCFSAGCHVMPVKPDASSGPICCVSD